MLKSVLGFLCPFKFSFEPFLSEKAENIECLRKGVKLEKKYWAFSP